ncbi:mechanosensitive ion channel family protein [Celerinatantimonas yamalensis]|uniref:Small-conductance mechanosensitive channel n=1 Tax=Celerinatantimonas yamalensis TaxID=559956 RepID=A0ABW9G6G8_9GAMM
MRRVIRQGWISLLIWAMFTIPVYAQVQSEQLILKESLQKGQDDLNSLGQIWRKSESDMSRSMLLQQISSRVDELNALVLKNTRSQSQLSIAANDALVKKMLTVIELQKTQAPQRLRDLFHSYEQASLANKPLSWLTVSSAMHYQSSLYSKQSELIERLRDVRSRKEYRVRFHNDLLRYVNDLANYLNASIKKQDQIKDEIGSLTKVMHQQMSDELTLQQRVSKTLSDNISQLVPVLKVNDIDVTVYNQLIFSASGELSDLVINSDGFLSFIRTFFFSGDQFFVVSIKSFLPKALIFILMIVLFYGISRVMKQLVSKMVRSKHSRMSTLVQDFFIATTGKSVILLGILAAFSQIGVDLAPILAGLGVAGIVIGFALQDTLSNFASGMMILIYRPFDVGDYVDAGGVSGKVSYMSLVNTTIRTFDNQKIMVPNNKIWGSTINNITAERVRRVDMEFSISYDDDILLAEKVLRSIIDEHPDVLREPEPVIRLMRLGESSVDFIVRPWVRTEAYWELYWDVTRSVKLRFDEVGLSIPFPQRDVHLYQHTHHSLSE